MELATLFDERFPHADFHDSIIEQIKLDYLKREASFTMSISIGDAQLKEETRHSGTLIFTGLAFCNIEVPVLNSNCDRLWVADEGEIASLPNHLTPKNPQFINSLKVNHYFFINNWNAFIFIAAEDASFEWQ